MNQPSDPQKNNCSALPPHLIPCNYFPNIEAAINELKQFHLDQVDAHHCTQQIYQTLHELILKTSLHSFLLPAVLNFLGQINREKLLSDPVNLAGFESWLNHSSSISPKENGEIREKITGKFLPREEYQVFFPIGMNKTYPGSHFVAAHLSPDVDTMIASFWGWIDAFAARVGTEQHIWHLPGGPPDSPITTLFRDLLSPELFALIAHTGDTLTLKPNDLNKENRGTVSLRDFCNLEEVRLGPNLEVISVVDHHKSTLKTTSAPTALIGDVQSCNVLVAEQMFLLNDKYSLGGMTSEQIDAQLQEFSAIPTLNINQIRIQQRLLQRRLNFLTRKNHFVHPSREYIEYISFLHAILEDTDLLSKASYRDVECMAQLLNRVQSLIGQRECEIIDFDNITRDKNFVRTAVRRLLEHPALYAMYKHTYSAREKDVEENFALLLQRKASSIFLDTKVQNKCARVGQTKLFASNFPYFLKHSDKVRQLWLDQASAICEEEPKIDLYIQMISTIAGAEEVYHNQSGSYSHRDELWLWAPATECGYEHLKKFLSGFMDTMRDHKHEVELEFFNSPSEKFFNAFHDLFPENTKKKEVKEGAMCCAILRFQPGAVNSRKAMITPFLPSL